MALKQFYSTQSESSGTNSTSIHIVNAQVMVIKQP